MSDPASQADLDAMEEKRREVEHRIMSAAGIPPCPNRARKEYVHGERCDAIAAVLATERSLVERYRGLLAASKDDIGFCWHHSQPASTPCGGCWGCKRDALLGPPSPAERPPALDPVEAILAVECPVHRFGPCVTGDDGRMFCEARIRRALPQRGLDPHDMECIVEGAERPSEQE